MTTDSRTSVLFVCMGNICRSPLAEGVFIQMANDAGVLDRFHIDSCGTGGWHAGNPADPRSIEVAERHGIHLPSRARQVIPADDFTFDWIIVMDVDNRDALADLGAPMDRVHLLRAFDPELADTDDHERQVPDPYYGGADGFDVVYHMVVRGCEGLMRVVSS